MDFKCWKTNKLFSWDDNQLVIKNFFYSNIQEKTVYSLKHKLKIIVCK